MWIVGLFLNSSDEIWDVRNNFLSYVFKVPAAQIALTRILNRRAHEMRNTETDSLS